MHVATSVVLFFMRHRHMFIALIGSAIVSDTGAEVFFDRGLLRAANAFGVAALVTLSAVEAVILCMVVTTPDIVTVPSFLVLGYLVWGDRRLLAKIRAS